MLCGECALLIDRIFSWPVPTPRQISREGEDEQITKRCFVVSVSRLSKLGKTQGKTATSRRRGASDSQARFFHASATMLAATTSADSGTAGSPARSSASHAAGAAASSEREISHAFAAAAFGVLSAATAAASCDEKSCGVSIDRCNTGKSR